MHAIRPAAILEKLRADGCKLTVARRAMVDILCASVGPLSVAELRAALGKRALAADKTTVYREVRFLESRGIVAPVHFGDRVVRYEPADRDHHHHLVCEECGDAVDVPLKNDLAAAERAIARKTGFAITRHSLEFFGVCRDSR